VSPACAARSTKPILGHVRLDAADGVLRLEATDLEIAIRTDCGGVDVQRAGSCTIDPKKLAAILGSTDDADVTLTADAGEVTVKTSTGRFKLHSHDVADFPAMVDGAGEGFEVTGLPELIKRTAYAADRKESGARWAVTGVLLEVISGKLSLVATDTKRLAVNTIDVTAENATALIPAKACEMVRNMAGRSSRPMAR
jgi:DNA polymerase-3 subunit beta